MDEINPAEIAAYEATAQQSRSQYQKEVGSLSREHFSNPGLWNWIAWRAERIVRPLRVCGLYFRGALRIGRGRRHVFRNENGLLVLTLSKWGLEDDEVVFEAGREIFLRHEHDRLAWQRHMARLDAALTPALRELRDRRLAELHARQDATHARRPKAEREQLDRATAEMLAQEAADRRRFGAG